MLIFYFRKTRPFLFASLLPTKLADKSKLRNELIVYRLINLLISSLVSHANITPSGHAAELGGSLGKLVSDETSSGSGSSSETSSPLDSPRHSPSLSIVSTPSPRKAGIYDSDETDALNFTDFSKPMNGKLPLRAWGNPVFSWQVHPCHEKTRQGRDWASSSTRWRRHQRSSDLAQR